MSREVLERALELARKAAPGSDVEVEVLARRQANTRFARSEITSTGDSEETAVRVRIAYGQRRASAETNQTTAEALRASAQTAERLARLAPADPEAMPPLPPQKYPFASPAWDEKTATLDAGARASAIVSAIEQADRAKVELAGYFEHESSRTFVGNSAGLRAEHAATRLSFSNTARTSDGKGSGWAGEGSHRAGDLDFGKLARAAIDKARSTAQARPLDPGRYTVVLEPAAVAHFVRIFRQALGARSADEGRSFFSRPGGGNLLGEKLFADSVTLATDPADPDLPSSPFDADGQPRGRTVWIDKGVLRALSCSRFWAKKTGRAPLPGGGGARLVSGGATTDDLVKGTKRGVLITRFWYIRALEPRQLLVTGLTRDGVFLIEDGRVVSAVNNFRFNESPAAMLHNVEALGSGLSRPLGEFGGGDALVPALRAHDFNLVSVSSAV